MRHRQQIKWLYCKPSLRCAHTPKTMATKLIIKPKLCFIRLPYPPRKQIDRAIRVVTLCLPAARHERTRSNAPRKKRWARLRLDMTSKFAGANSEVNLKTFAMPRSTPRHLGTHAPTNLGSTSDGREPRVKQDRMDRAANRGPFPRNIHNSNTK